MAELGDLHESAEPPAIRHELDGTSVLWLCHIPVTERCVHDYDAANRRGEFNGRIVAIGSTGSGRDASVNEQDGLFTLVISGTAWMMAVSIPWLSVTVAIAQP